MKNILITGLPGAGKTTIIVKLSEIFKEFNPAGFYTTEIIEEGIRTGFELVNLNGDSTPLAHINIKSKYCVGKYKVDLKSFEAFVENIFLREKKTGLYIIDEIGKMECMSKKFSRLVVTLLDSNKPVIASISEKGNGIINDIKKRNDIKLIDITHHDREMKIKELTMAVRDILIE